MDNASGYLPTSYSLCKAVVRLQNHPKITTLLKRKLKPTTEAKAPKSYRPKCLSKMVEILIENNKSVVEFGEKSGKHSKWLCSSPEKKILLFTSRLCWHILMGGLLFLFLAFFPLNLGFFSLFLQRQHREVTWLCQLLAISAELLSTMKTKATHFLV